MKMFETVKKVLLRENYSNEKMRSNNPPQIDMSGVERLCAEEVSIDCNSYYSLPIKITEYAFKSMDDRDISRLVRDVDNTNLAVFMKGLSGNSRRIIFNSFSKRLAVLIAEDIDFMGEIRDKDKALAAYNIIRTLIRLMNEGEIGTDNDYLYMLYKIYADDKSTDGNDGDEGILQ